jgi:DNA-binding MltR family transcriptional regulator
MSHAGVVLTSAAILDQMLERAIKTVLPNVKGKLSKRLFGDRGPLYSFAAKIDMAHALGITSEHVYGELQKVREMRNKFAHSEKLLSLDAEPVRSMFLGLHRPAGITGSWAEQYMACVLAIDDYLEKFLHRMGETEGMSLRWLKSAEVPTPK